ncbi:formyltransferase family protein [Falsiroseomonas sp.]|uniref:formyltransferase family protein n=1 Tax=Falsiroseomonas sp. TaxID=2870721 RepID=UPI002724B0D7|nr:formyltransferase family protein [Falsiroseomonas sp.]MDO9502507.1 formyltransferase family protein [Falsiroseomonas sp.]
MRIAICVKKDIHGLLAARILAARLGFAKLRFFCSVKTRQAEADVPALRLMKLLERDVAIDTLAMMEPPTPGLPPPDEWVELHDMRADGGAARLLDFRPDIVISARFSLIFPQRVIDAVPRGIINVHPGALPGYRGLFAPFWQVLRGERELGCTVHMVDRGIDTGPILGVARLPFDATRSLMWHTAGLYRGGVAIAATAANTLARGGQPAGVPQPAGGAYFRFPAAADFAALPVPIVSARDYAQVLGDAFAPVPDDCVTPRRQAA